MAVGTGKPGEALTTIDSLVELLHTKGKMELTKIVEALGIDAGIIENWAKVLEENNLVRITYEVGRMYIEPMSVPKEQEQALAVTTEAQRSHIETDASMQRAMLEKYASKLDSLSTSVKTASSLFQQKFPDFEKQLEGINKIYSALAAESASIDNIKKNADMTYEGINRKVTSLYSKIEGVDINTAQTAKEQLAKIESTLKKAYELEGQIELLSRSKDKTLDAIRKSIEDQLRSLERDLGRAESNIDAQLRLYKASIMKDLSGIREQERLIDELTRQISSFRREKEAVKKTLSTTKASFNDEYIKISTRMEATSGELKNQIGAMTKELDKMKSSFGEVATVYDNVQRMKKDLDDITKEIADLRAELESIIDEAQSMQKRKASPEGKAAAVKKAEERTAASESKRMDLTNKIDKLQSDFDNTTDQNK